ncbi:hypothetical protein KJ562_01710 [Patescibacteria group bacterium]|nr:hypothetical protein [Patescibacteria group bacterium]MBU4162298.1 hypothetical protein [Patescibacteria group bacterium]
MNYRKIFYLSIFLIILTVFLLFMFCIFPALRAINLSSKELALRRQELASIEFLAQSFEDFEKNFQFYEEGLAEMDNLLQAESLIDPEIPVSFINFFKEEALNLNLVLKISPVAFHENNNGQWDYMVFRIDGMGKFVDAMKFLEKLENSRWLIKETTFDISSVRQVQGAEESKFGGDYVEIYLSIEAYAKN